MDPELHKIVITAIIYNDGQEFLITKRSMGEEQWPGRWSVPGGKLSKEDYVHTPLTHKNQWYYALTDTLKREVKEEVGLTVGKPEYLLDLIFLRKSGIPTVVLSFFAEYLGGDVRLDDEHSEYAWVRAEDLSNYDLIEGVDHEIKLVDEILRKRKNT